MKPVFYKKLIPLAMIASMAVTSTGLAEAVSANTFSNNTPDSIVYLGDEDDTEPENPDNPPVVDEKKADDLFSSTQQSTYSENVNYNIIDDEGTTGTYSYELTLAENIGENDLSKFEFAVVADGSNSDCVLATGIDITKTTIDDVNSKVIFELTYDKGVDIGCYLGYKDEDSYKKLTAAPKLSITNTPVLSNDSTITIEGQTATTIGDGEYGYLNYSGSSVVLDLGKLYSKYPDLFKSGDKEVKGIKAISNTVETLIVPDGWNITENALTQASGLKKIEFKGTVNTNITADRLAKSQSLTTVDFEKETDATKELAEQITKTNPNVIVVVEGQAANSTVLYKSGNDGFKVTTGNLLTNKDKTGYVVQVGGTTVADMVAGEVPEGVEVKEDDIVWTLYTAGTNKKSGVAAIAKPDKNNKAVTGNAVKGSALKQKGTVEIVNLKNTSKFNSALELRAEYKYKDGKTTKTATIASYNFFVEPVYATAFKDQSDVTKANQYELKKAAENASYDYDLTIYEGKSYKLPFALAPIKIGTQNVNPSDKTLVYFTPSTYDEDGELVSGSQGFSVSNGTVKGLSAGGSGTITVAPKTSKNGDPHITVNVTVKAAETNVKLSADRTNVSVLNKSVADRYNTVSADVDSEFGDPYLGEPITIRASKPTSADLAVTYTVPEGYEVVDADGVAISSDGKTTLKNGAAQIYVKTTKDNAAKGNLVVNCGTQKVTVKLSSVDTLKDVTSVKQTGKVNKQTGEIDITIPVGSTYNLGASVQPVGAYGELNYWAYSDVEDYSFNHNEDETSIISMTGDVIKANEVGTVKIEVYPEGNLASNFDYSKLKTYNVTVYNPGSAYMWNDPVYTIRDNFLVLNDNATNKVLVSNKIEIAEPVFEGALGEEVVWTSNNAAACSVVKNYDEETGTSTLTITPTVAGTYTITGVSSISKQKYTFKVSVSETDVLNDGNEYKVSLAQNGEALEADATKTDEYILTAGETANIVAELTKGFAGKVTVTSKDTKTISVKNGVVKAVKPTESGKPVELTVKIEKNTKNKANPTFDLKESEKTIKINVVENPAIFVTPFANGVAAGKKFTPKAAISNTVGAKIKEWKYVSVTEDEEIDASKAETLGNTGIAKAGKYFIWPVYMSTKNNAVLYDGKDSAVTVNVYETAVSKNPVVLDPVSTVWDLKDINDSKSFETIDGKKVLTKGIPMAVTDESADSDAVNSVIIPIATYEADYGYINWTSSNSYIATAERYEVDADDNPYADKEAELKKSVLAKFGNGADVEKVKISYVEIVPTGISAGTVKLTGVCDNGGKKITISVFVNEHNTDALPPKATKHTIDTNKFSVTDTKNKLNKTAKLAATGEDEDSSTKTATFTIGAKYTVAVNTRKEFIDIENDFSIVDKAENGTAVEGFKVTDVVKNGNVVTVTVTVSGDIENGEKELYLKVGDKTYASKFVCTVEGGTEPTTNPDDGKEEEGETGGDEEGEKTPDGDGTETGDETGNE